MRLKTIISSLLLMAPLAPLARAQTTQPAGGSASLELRATESFNRGNYAAALPMLQQLSVELGTTPANADKLAMVQEQIRVCQKNPTASVVQTSAVTSVGDSSPFAPPSAAGPPPIATGSDRHPHALPKPGETLEMTIKELGNFEYDPEHPTPLPDDVQHLSGANIRLRGYMIPMDQAESISQFALVPSLFACCYGQPPQIQHTIVVNCPKGKAVNYYPDEIVVEGKLTVAEKKDDGFIVSLFEIGASSVKPAPK